MRKLQIKQKIKRILENERIFAVLCGICSFVIIFLEIMALQHFVVKDKLGDMLFAAIIWGLFVGIAMFILAKSDNETVKSDNETAELKEEKLE